MEPDAEQCRWVRPSDGGLVPLVLQSLDDVRHLPETSRWLRIGKPVIRVPPLIRVSYWIISSILEPGQTKRKQITLLSLALVLAKTLVALPLLCILMLGFDNFTVIHRRAKDGVTPDTQYDPVRGGCRPVGLEDSSLSLESAAEIENSYRDALPQETTPPSQRPHSDDIRLDPLLHPPASSQSTNYVTGDSIRGAQSLIRPRYLCLVRDFDNNLVETIKVSDYLKEHGDDVDLEFIFVSYTRLQFRVATVEEIEDYDYPNEETREANKQLAQRDRQELIRWGIDAAKRAGKQAFWLDFECVRNEDGSAQATSNSDDVYRICDIVRVAHSMIIAIGPTASDKLASILRGKETPPFARENVTTWLQQWGSRLWTLPELLLCPNEYRIRLYVSGDSSEPKSMAKRNFAEKAWEDADAVKELVDHFEGSAILTQLHLISAALRCFSRRKTDQFSQGDIAYAIMGLFPSRQRPIVNKGDSGFQAFAKLSLANDSGAFLERLICLAPPRGAPWHETTDRWGTTLSDVRPSNKVTKILAPDTLVLDGVHGATIHWDNLDAEPAFSADSRALVVTFVLTCIFIPYAFRSLVFVIIVMIITHNSMATLVPFLTISQWLLLSIPISALIAPLMLIFGRRGTNRQGKPRLIGIEGIAEVGSVEKYLWGFNHGRLIDMTPQSYYDEPQQNESNSFPQPKFTFTLVDTAAMTIHYLRCCSPPVAMLVLGEDSAMQRGVLCSYDWRDRTFHRQEVLRLTRGPSDQMHLIDQLRFNLSSSQGARFEILDNREAPLPTDMETQNIEPNRSNQRFFTNEPHSWVSELIFFSLCLMALPARLSNEPRARLYFLLSFILAQPIACLLLLRAYLSKVIRSVTLVISLYRIVSRLSRFFWPYRQTRLVFLALGGFTQGLLTFSVIVFVWSWYSPKAITMRLLTWVCLGSLVVNRLPYHDFVVIFLSFLPSTFPPDIIGRPVEVSWLSPPQRLSIMRQAATQQIDFPEIGLQQLRKYSFNRWFRLLLPLGLSFSTSMTCGSKEIQSYSFEMVLFGQFPLFLMIALVISRVPSISIVITSFIFTVPTLLSLLQTTALITKTGYIYDLLTNLSWLVMPFISSIIIQQSRTWTEAFGSLSLSSVGLISGDIFRYYTEDWSVLPVLLSKLAAQIVLWALFWVVSRRDMT